MAFPINSLIENEIRKINDSDYSEFEGFPANNLEVSQRWAALVDFVGANVIQPSTTAAIAKTALEAHWAGGVTLANFVTGFTVYTTQLAIGQAPLYTGVAPPIPMVLDPVFAIGNSGGSGQSVAAAMAPIVSTWFKTGTAILVASPFTVVPWT